jgi:hypothetical protein
MAAQKLMHIHGRLRAHAEISFLTTNGRCMHVCHTLAAAVAPDSVNPDVHRLFGTHNVSPSRPFSLTFVQSDYLCYAEALEFWTMYRSSRTSLY